MDEEKSKTSVESAEEKFYEFIEGASHDLQAPLRKISVLVERAFKKDEKKFDDDTKEYIRRIESCVDEMKLLLGGLLELVKADASTDVNEVCDLNEIAREILESMSEEIKNRHVIVSMATLPAVHGKRLQYARLLKNLIGNAVKFSKRDTDPRVEITTTILTDENRNNFHLENKKYYRIEISDNGVGFHPSNDQKIFEPFVRLHPRAEFEGNGLGLFICKKIVARHNGIIYAEGNEKQGARFVLVLPETP
ncbi:MAG: hypothetical protein E6H10_04425 [Bacteroidetes bacterium]|nr:MAG: hypothetical protein E6H10_04425 [Bacteroidota bacterium]